MKITVIPRFKKFENLLKLYPPQPANKFLPKWYKEISLGDLDYKGRLSEPHNQFNNTTGISTAKKCPAIQDLITTGLILPLWGNLYFKTNRDENKNINNQRWDFTAKDLFEQDDIDHHIQFHDYEQTKGMDLNRNFRGGIFKIMYPFKFILPKGYNVIYSDPFYHFRKDIRALTGMVEVDKWGYITFPFETISDNFVMKTGTPLIHAFFYKRKDTNNMDLEIRNGTQKEYDNNIFEQERISTSEKHYKTQW